MRSALVLCCTLTLFTAAVLSFAGAEPAGPALFAEGIVSTPDDESGFALMPDGNTAFFGKTSPATSGGDPMWIICVTHRDASGRWSTPEIAPFSGKYRDMGPAMAPDGSRLYFTSDRPRGDSDKRDLNIWYIDRDGSAWREPKSLDGPVNSPAQEYGVSVTRNGTLYFASNRAGGKGSFDIYRSELADGRYKIVENLGDGVNSIGVEVEPAVSPDESMLVFTGLGREDETIGVHRAYGRGDLYVSFRKNGVWTEARNCGAPVNSGGGESWPALSSDGARLFFSSDRGFATYRMPRRMTWGEIERGLRSTLNGMGNIYEVNTLRLFPRDRR